MATPQQGYLVIADITGYTSYLSRSELSHAQDVLGALLELLISHTNPPLVISELEGDAVLSYTVQAQPVNGQTFIEMIEDTYVAFRRAIDLMVLNTTCDCNACANIGSLDLKFFIHHGSFSLQQLESRVKPMGSDVVLIHRLAKNTIAEATGVTAYTLYTDAAISQLGLDPEAAGFTSHEEEYLHLGRVRGWVQDMHPIWREKSADLRIEIPLGDVLVEEEGDFPLPPELVWDYLTQPEHRATFQGAVSQKIDNRSQGRIGPGTVYQCFHGGNSVTTQTVLEWLPFSQMTTEDTTPVPKTTMLLNIKLEPFDVGTRVTVVFGKAKGPLLNRIICNVAGKRLIKRDATKGFTALREVMEHDLAVGTVVIPDTADIPSHRVSESVAATLGRNETR